MFLSTLLISSLLVFNAPQIKISEFKTLDLENKIEILSESYGLNPDIATAIIACESRNNPNARHNNKDRKGNIWSSDHGYWQINDYYHRKTALKLGYDLNDHDENLMYGFYVLKKQGTAPWKASKYRWQKMIDLNLSSCPDVGYN